MKKIAIYARQSIDKKDSLSIETQIEECQRFVSKNEPFKIYSDKGYTGSNTKRPDFQSMMDDVRNDLISKVIVYKVDRFSRNILDFFETYSVLSEKKVDFISVNDSFDTTNPTGRAMLSIIMVFAQLERENIQLRVKDNYYYRILDGRWAGGPAPYGFRNAKCNGNVPTLIQDEKEIEAIKYIFQEYAYSPKCSLGKLARDLYSMGYRSRRESGTFDNVTISRLLQSPVYAVADERLQKYYQLRGAKLLNTNPDGNLLVWTGKTSCHIVGKKVGNANVRKYTDLSEQSIYLTNFSGVIDSKTFILVQDRLSENEQISGANKPTNMKELTGLIKCKKCGYAIKMYSKPYLACYGRYGLKTCDAVYKGIKLDEIRETVAKEVQEVLNTMVSDMLNRQIEQQKIKKAIEEQNEEIKNLVKLFKKYPNLDLIQAEMDACIAERARLELNELMDIKLSEHLKISSSLPLKFSRLSDDEKIMTTHFLIDKIYLSEDGKIEIIWKV